MTISESETRSIVVDRMMRHSPEKIWRALTQSHLIAEWLMQNDFQPVVGHKFHFRSKPVAGWNGIADCEVLVVEPLRRLVWSQNASGEQAATGLKSIVSWTLTPVDGGVQVRMEQSGFRSQDEAGFQAMSHGWPRVVERMEQISAGA